MCTGDDLIKQNNPLNAHPDGVTDTIVSIYQNNATFMFIGKNNNEYMCCTFAHLWRALNDYTNRHTSNLLCGMFFSKGLWGLVAMLASSANQLVLGEQLNSWCNTPGPRWYNPGDLWSSSTSCRSGMSSEGKATVTFKYNTRGNISTSIWNVSWNFTIIHVTPRWGRQVFITLERVKGLIHFVNTWLVTLFLTIARKEKQQDPDQLSQQPPAV